MNLPNRTMKNLNESHPNRSHHHANQAWCVCDIRACEAVLLDQTTTHTKQKPHKNKQPTHKHCKKRRHATVVGRALLHRRALTRLQQGTPTTTETQNKTKTYSAHIHVNITHINQHINYKPDTTSQTLPPTKESKDLRLQRLRRWNLKNQA